MLTVEAEALGSWRVMWRALEPQARRESSGKAQIESNGCCVVRESTCVYVVKSHVLIVWSQETEYATVASFGANATPETGLS